MSRKTTKIAVAAFLAGNKVSTSNTTTDGNALFLFGNKIAEKRTDGIYITNAGWFSATTKERLNGLPNVLIHQDKGEWYLNGNKWDGEWTLIAN
jgi:hypothetical protein